MRKQYLDFMDGYQSPRRDTALEVKVPVDVKRNPDPQGRAKDDVITPCKRPRRKTDLKPMRDW